MKAVVIDDEPLARDELKFLLEQCDGMEVIAEAANAQEAQKVCEELAPDVAFIDLRMPGGPDGITLAEALLGRNDGLHIVIVSAHDDGALRAFEARAVDYLLKPVRLERLQDTVARLRESTLPKTGETLSRLAVRRKGAYVVLDVQDVVFFEVKDDLVWAVTQKDRFALDKTLTALQRGLDDTVFFRSHRGFIVNLNHIREITPAGTGTFQLLMNHPDAPEIPLARERAKQLKERIPFSG